MDQPSNVPPDRVTALREWIRAVFADVPMPERDAIARHRCCECDTLRATFAGRHWSTFDASLLEANYDQLPLLSPEGLAFYLPAYLLHALASLAAPDNVTDYTVWHLAPTHNDVDPAYYRARLRVMTPEQFAVLSDFIDLVVADERLREAYEDLEEGHARLHHYWQTRWE
jgi:hypothetical protein